MNTVAVSDSQVTMILVACLAVLHAPSTVEEKAKVLEEALMSRVLQGNQSIPFVQIGLPIVDESVIAFASAVETRLKNLDISKISTGSPTLDSALGSYISQVVSSNFNQD